MKIKRLLGCAVILLVVTAAFAEESEHHSAAAIQAFNQGVKQLNANQPQDAIPSFDEAISQDDQFAEAYYARGACHQAMKDTTAALSDLNEAIRLKPGYADAYSMRGVIYYQSEQMDAAYEDFGAVLRLKPSDAQALLGHGVLALKKDKLQTAQHDFKAFLRVRPNDPLAPKLRKVLASLSQDSQRTASASAEASSADSGRAVSLKSERLAEELFLRAQQQTDSYTQRVIRGQQSEAVGNINTVHDAPTSNDSDGGLRIVDPQ